MNEEKPPSESLTEPAEFADEAARKRYILASYEAVAGEQSYLQTLIDTSARYLDSATDFKPGCVVKWKQGLKYGLIPEYGRPMVYLGPYVRNSKALVIGPSTEELADCLIGFIDSDRDFSLRAVDKRRLQAWDDGASGTAPTA